MKPESKRDQILKAAEEVFAEKGLKGTTVREIAERVDLQTPGLYHHFSSKEEIYYSVIQDIYFGFGDKVLEPMRRAVGIEEKVTVLIDKLMEFWEEQPNAPMIFAQELMLGSGPFYEEMIPNMLGPMYVETLSAFEEEKGSGNIRDLDMSMLIYLIFGMAVFYFFAGHILTLLAGVDSFAPERIQAAKEEIKNLVFDGIKS
jgi:TetR/AcrR family transcriptional regulator